MNENTKIYICTHTDFDCPVHNPVYEILDTRKLFKSANSNGVDELFYSELRTYLHLSRHWTELPKYVGFCQYRKYWEFMDDVPDLEQIIQEHGCIALEPYTVKKSVYDQYARCFFFGDMDIMKAILWQVNNPLYLAFEKMLKGDQLYIGNMVIMPRERFVEVMDIIGECLQTYLIAVGKDIRQRILDHSTLYLKRAGIGSQIEHQYRLGGSLGERIMSAYIMQNFPNVKTYKMVLTEKRARPYRKLRNRYE